MQANLFRKLETGNGQLENGSLAFALNFVKASLILLYLF